MEPENNPFMNRRKYVRLMETLIVRVARLGPPPAKGLLEAHWTASTVDISEGGMLLRCTDKLRLGEGLEILFELERGTPQLRAVAHVVRYHSVMYDKIYYVPVAFTEIDASTRERIRAFAARQSSER